MASDLKERIIAALREVHDPEIPVNLYDLGLIYELVVGAGGVVDVRMTLTTPNCPVAEMMPRKVQEAVESVDGVEEARIELVWNPPWSGEMMSEDARMTLDMMGISWRDPHSSVNRTTPVTVRRTGVDRGSSKEQRE